MSRSRSVTSSNYKNSSHSTRPTSLNKSEGKPPPAQRGMTVLGRKAVEGIAPTNKLSWGSYSHDRTVVSLAAIDLGPSHSNDSVAADETNRMKAVYHQLTDHFFKQMKECPRDATLCTEHTITIADSFSSLCWTSVGGFLKIVAQQETNEAEARHDLDFLVYLVYLSQGDINPSRLLLWGPLIGIDEYPSYPLRGCVPDVRLMEKYLTGDLGVPSDHAMKPSRDHIIGALLCVIDNPKIGYGVNIIIYYSGHGSYYEFPAEEEEGSESIEALCPIDRDTPGGDGKPVPDISDRELNTTLSLISRNRITVILDCCHSGGLSRSTPYPGVRRTPPTTWATLRDMLITGDRTLKVYPGYRSIFPKDWCSDMDSHVVLAAWKAYQFAKPKKVKGTDGEAGYIGIFTDSLIRALRSSYWGKETTYADLVHYLDETPYQDASGCWKPQGGAYMVSAMKPLATRQAVRSRQKRTAMNTRSNFSKGHKSETVTDMIGRELVSTPLIL
ncbi:hypothetical protein ARMGADRAFT_1028484 [Armillaria gallica]|uniref:Peptidase C14 caspase domain-containing protein n=1 Tax=Armillaria gallica TaxID=47427 RepID=A0A2H3DMG4_ARMGA|nr:hypothetical protein ARMGADRAFT_1028484 [Armillaria gallica]